MGIPSIPKPPKPPALPPPPPTELDPAVRARRKRFTTSVAKGGRSSTILTSPQGLPSLGSTLLTG